MSFSNPTIGSPVTKYYRFSSKSKGIVYWDKDQEVEVAVKTPFDFIVLDDRAGVGGYNAKVGAGFYSTRDVKYISTEPLVVKCGKDTVYEGLWKDADSIKSQGAKYSTVLYIMEVDTGEVAKLTLVGSGVSAWMDFSKGVILHKAIISFTGVKEKKNAATSWFEPVFEAKPLDEEVLTEQATELDKQLQKYFKTRKLDNIDDVVVEEEEQSEPVEKIDTSDLPF